MQGQSYLIEKVILYLFLTAFALWGINYGVPRIADQVEKMMNHPFEPKAVSL